MRDAGLISTNDCNRIVRGFRWTGAAGWWWSAYRERRDVVG
jgi:hypothetical protein